MRRTLGEISGRPEYAQALKGEAEKLLKVLKIWTDESTLLLQLSEKAREYLRKANFAFYEVLPPPVP
jgi:hypothetical protein